MTQLHDLRKSLAERWPAAFSAAEVARRIGVSERTIRRWEAGEDWPRRRHLQALGNELGFRVVDERPEAIEAAAGLARLQPVMAERGTYMASDQTFRDVAIIVRDTTVAMWRPAPVIEASLRSAEAANPAGTYAGDLIREAAMFLRATTSLAAQRTSERWFGTLELAIMYQPNSVKDVQNQLRVIAIPNHPDVEVRFLNQRTPDSMTLGFDFQAASADEADEIARLYADRVVVQFERYRAKILSVSAN